MIGIGNHLSLSLGYEGMLEEEKKLGGDTFAFFTRNPRGGNKREVNVSDLENLSRRRKEEHFYPLVAHMPYTMNLCSDKEDIREYSIRMFQEDLELMEHIEGCYLNFHPGSRLTQPLGTATQEIIEGLNRILPGALNTTILLETMAGKGSEVGRTFEELKAILYGVKDNSHLGICLDTCHVFDGGYDIVNHLDDVLQEFDRVLSLKRLKAIHLNDSKNVLGSHKDRHERIGYGNIGKEALLTLVRHPLLQGIPFILETPNSDEGYREEIALVKENRLA